MIIFNRGIYFNQIDRKEKGYHSEDSQGNVIHKEYKKPTLWQRTKFLATYGYEMNLETRLTTYIHFDLYSNELTIGSLVSDAITTAKELKKNRSNEPYYKYVLEGNNINFETPYAFIKLKFQDDGLQFKLYAKRKSDNVNLDIESFLFLNWENL